MGLETKYGEFVEAGLWAAGFAAVVELVPLHYRPFGVAAFLLLLLPRFSYLFRIRRTGLKAVYYRGLEEARNPLREALRKSESGDEVLFVGRTHRGLLSGSGKELNDVLKRGVTLKLLFLDLRALAESKPGQSIDLRYLRLPNAHGKLVEDLGESERMLRNLRDSCRADNVPGSLLVYRTELLVQSTVVAFRPRNPQRPMRLLYDFSFGDKDEDKFIQFYKASQSTSRADFCNRLHQFNASMFDADVSSLAYELSYLPSKNPSPLVALQEHATARLRNVLDTHPQHEGIRDNSLLQIIPAAAGVFSTLARESKIVPPPISVQVELTNKCSTSCAHCSRYFNSHTPEMDHTVAAELLAELGYLGVGTIVFSGGEPTQHSHFNELLETAVDNKLAVGVLSNGVGLSDETLRNIHDHARWLRLSIDGSSATIYGRIRKSLRATDAFTEVTNTIRRFVQLNKAKQRCKLAICYTIQRENVADVPDMIKFVSRQGLPEGDRALVLKFAHGSGDFLCTPQQLHWLYDKVLTRAEFGGAANIPYLRWFLEQQSSMQDLIKGRPTETMYLQQKTRCFTPHLFSLIDPSGGVYPCCFLFEDNSGYVESITKKREDHCLGRLGVDGTFKKIWEGPKYQQLRDELWKIDPSSERFSPCGECTRHCNHNRWLSQLYEEYRGLQVAGGDADAVMQSIGQNADRRPIWL